LNPVAASWDWKVPFECFPVMGGSSLRDRWQQRRPTDAAAHPQVEWNGTEPGPDLLDCSEVSSESTRPILDKKGKAT